MDSFEGVLKRATVPRAAGVDIPAARFSLLMAAGQDPVAKLSEVQGALAAGHPAVEVRFLSSQEHQIIVAIFPDRSFGPDDAATFAAGYALAAQFQLEAAEPDLPTNFYPQPLSPMQTKGPAAEGFISFPPGCFVPAEPALDQRPRWALETIRVPEAWQFSEQQRKPDRGLGVLIAQPDTGITRHPELASVVESNPFNVLDESHDPTDPLTENVLGNPGHGTGAASVVVSPESLVVVGAAARPLTWPSALSTASSASLKALWRKLSNGPWHTAPISSL